MTTVAPAVRLLSAVRAGEYLAARPHGRVHVYVGPLTPSGRFIPSKRPTVCRARTRRLTVVERLTESFDLRGRRVCARCLTKLEQRVGLLVSRDDWAAAFGHLTVEDLMLAAKWTRTVDECHQVGFLSSVVLGPGATKPVDSVLNKRRRELANRELTPDEREARKQERKEQAEEDARIAVARRKNGQMARRLDRENRGQYIAPWERATT